MQMKYIFSILAIVLPQVVCAQQYAQRGDQIPIAQGVADGSQRQSTQGADTCVQAQTDLENTVNRLNGNLYRMETNPSSGYYVRHQDRMAIITLIQQELQPTTDAIHHAIFLGNGKFCLDKLQAGVRLANSIYQANLEYRKNGR
jgi:hypothetical protein